MQLQEGFPKGEGAQLEIVTADITEPQTLSSRVVDGCSAVISAAAAIVSPKEGDTPDRQKYKQVKSDPGSIAIIIARPICILFSMAVTNTNQSCPHIGCLVKKLQAAQHVKIIKDIQTESSSSQTQLQAGELKDL